MLPHVCSFQICKLEAEHLPDHKRFSFACLKQNVCCLMFALPTAPKPAFLSNTHLHPGMTFLQLPESFPLSLCHFLSDKSMGDFRASSGACAHSTAALATSRRRSHLLLLQWARALQQQNKRHHWPWRRLPLKLQNWAWAQGSDSSSTETLGPIPAFSDWH